MDVIGLLQNKKRCLQHFLEVSENFFSDAEHGNLSALPSFEQQRDQVIKTLSLIDERLTDAVRVLPLEARTVTLSEQIRESLQEETHLVALISKVDNRIIECIEREKQSIQKDLLAARKNQEIAGRFKSTWVAEPGEELDQKA